MISGSRMSKLNVVVNQDSLTKGEEQFEVALFVDEEFNQLLTGQEVIINDSSEDFKKQVFLDPPSTIAFRVNDSILPSP